LLSKLETTLGCTSDYEEEEEEEEEEAASYF
jgi:hypothetical protein